MAFAESAKREVTTTVDVIRLDLSREEAETLRVILAYVGGSVDNSPRMHVSAISRALDPIIGVYEFSDSYELVEKDHPRYKGIHFRDFEESE